MRRLAAYELDIYDAVKQAHADLDAPQRWWDAEVHRLRKRFICDRPMNPWMVGHYPDMLKKLRDTGELRTASLIICLAHHVQTYNCAKFIRR